MKKIIYVQYTNPGIYPPLEHSSRCLSQDGWEVMFLGIGALNASVLCFPAHPQITVKLMPYCPPGWRQKLHYIQFCLWVVLETWHWQPRWVYASDSLSCPVALLISFFPKLSVIYHEHDTPSSTSNSLFIRLCLTARKHLATTAKMCVLPNQQRADRFQELMHSQKLFCVWNCPSQEEVYLPSSPRNPDELWIWYHGSIVPLQLPETILAALVILPAYVKLRVVGYETIGNEGYVEQLQKRAKELGISERFEYLGTLPTRKELFDSCQKCDIGIALFPHNNPQPMPGASNKPFDYLACGLALLVSDLPDWTQMYVEPGYGLACDPTYPESIAAQVKWFIEHPLERQEMGSRGKQRILQDWNYETQFATVKKSLI